MKKYKWIWIFMMVSPLHNIFAQVDTAFKKQPINYSTFMSLLSKNNLGYIAEKFNLNIAEANILSAGIFPDPELSFGYFDNGQRRMKMGNGFGSEINWTLELGAKRKARIELANNEYELTKYLLQDYLRNLRADATLFFLGAILKKQLLDVQINSYEKMNQIAKSDSIRFKLGSLTEVDARQSKLEAGNMLKDVYQAEAEWKMMLANLSVFIGKNQNDTLLLPQGNFTDFERNFTLQELIITAQNNRADLLAALQNKNVSACILKLAEANRVIDLGISGGITYASYVTNIIAPTPSFVQMNLGISIPLKFSNNRPGELKAAYFKTLQAEAQYKQIEIQIQNEVTQAYYNYLAQKKQIEQFNTGLLSEAKAILDGKIYSYQRGETSLIEVLNAQRTYNEIQISYFQTLYNYAAALVELERAAGIWDINF